MTEQSMCISRATRHRGGAAEAEGMLAEVLLHVAAVAVVIAPQGAAHELPLLGLPRQVEHVERNAGVPVRLHHAVAAVPEGELLREQLVPEGDVFGMV